MEELFTDPTKMSFTFGVFAEMMGKFPVATFTATFPALLPDDQLARMFQS